VVDKLQQTPGEYREACDRHSSHYAAYLQEREPRLRGSEQREALAEIAAEIDNVRAAWRWSVAHGKTGEMARSLEGLYLFYYERGWVQEGEEVFREALDVLRSEAAADERVVGRLLARQGRFAYRQGRYREARRFLQESLELLARLEAEGQPVVRRERAFSLFSLSVILRGDGAYGEAQRLGEESLEIYRQSGDRLGTAMALKQLGIISGSLGRYREAQEQLQEALALYQEIGDPYGIANTLNDLGVVAVWLDQRGEAKRLYQECLVIRRQLGDLWGIGTSLNNLGYLAYLDKAYAEAERLLGQSLVIQREIGDRYHIANCLNNLGAAVCAMGECQRAGPTFYEALRSAAEIGAEPLVLEVLAGIATLMAEGEREDVARAARLFAFVHDHPASDEPTKGRAVRGLAEVASHLPPQTLAAAQERGAGGELGGIVAEVLALSDWS
jgi:tetratricopeptide (TPR) repeat protein